MEYEWDPHKAKSNLRKHGVRFADAIGVFQDPSAITVLDDDSDEERYVTNRDGRSAPDCGRVLHLA